MNRLRVNFVDDRASFVPGESVSGTATWELETDPQSIELRLFWYTTGKGDQDLDVVQRLVFAPSRHGTESFQLDLPRRPFSFSGKLISVIWAVELVAHPGEFTERLEIIIGPQRREVRVDAGEG